MRRRFLHAVVLWSAAFSLPGVAGPLPVGATGEDAGAGRVVVSKNLHRVRVLLEGDARAVWVGDSWSLMHNAERVPYGALLTWPIAELSAVGVGFRPGTIIFGTDYTDGDGRLTLVNAARQWMVEFDQTHGQQYFGLPVLDVSMVRGEAGLLLDEGWPGVRRIQSMHVSNAAIDRGDLPVFAGAGDRVRCRVLYYAPRSASDLAESVRLVDGNRTPLARVSPRDGARPFWHLGEDAGGGGARPAAEAQVNALAVDVDLDASLPAGSRVVIAEDETTPLVGTGAYWDCAGTVFYRALEDGSARSGLYHSGLSGNSWSFAGLADDTPSSGGKNFSDEQLLHWLDVTTIRREQTPVVILHVATESKPVETLEQDVRRILERFRSSFAAIGAAPPRFLLLGSYMHRILDLPVEEGRVYVEALNSLYLSLAASEPDCAFFSLYHVTDGVFFTSDAEGGPGAQQQSRDWLDANGWSTITYGGVTYNLSSAEGGGLDGVLVSDGVHCGSTPAAAFYAKLIGDAIGAAACPGDFDGDGVVDTRDVIAFLNAWAGGDGSADFNGDGAVDTVDVIAFLNAWNEVC